MRKMEHVSPGPLRNCFYVPFRNAIHMFSANPAEGIFCAETFAVYPEIGQKKIPLSEWYSFILNPSLRANASSFIALLIVSFVVFEYCRKLKIFPLA